MTVPHKHKANMILIKGCSIKKGGGQGVKKIIPTPPTQF